MIKSLQKGRCGKYEEDREQENEKQKGTKAIFTISKKILALSLLPMIIVCALVATVGAKALETGIEKQIEQSLQIVGVSVDETYTNLYEGDYTRDKGRQGAQRAHIHFRGRHS